MDESNASQYALNVAVYTLKERCQTFQQRIAELEEENLNLRVQCNKHDSSIDSLSEIDTLKEKVIVLKEQKEQLNNKVKIVSLENQELWGKLLKLVNVNKNLGTQLIKINDSLKQHQGHQPLIRSKTFTQEQPHVLLLNKNLKDNEKISLELEDISLKLKSSLAKEKQEVDSLVSEISQIEDGAVISLGFHFEQVEEPIVEEVKMMLDEIKAVKENIFLQHEMLHRNIKKLKAFKENSKCKVCYLRNNKKKEEKSTNTSDLILERESIPDFTTNNEKSVKAIHQEDASDEKICPCCSKIFYKQTTFMEFVGHVESHYRIEDELLLNN